MTEQNKQSDTPAPAQHLVGEIERLRMALTDVVNPLGNLRRYAEENGTTLNGGAYGIANNLGFVQRIAKAALEEDASWLGHHSAPKPSGSTQNSESFTEKADPAKPFSLSQTPLSEHIERDRQMSPTNSSMPKLESSNYAIVPVKMTAAMINAWSGGLTVTTDEIAYQTSFQQAWSRVIAAAPSPQTRMVGAISETTPVSETDGAAFSERVGR